MSEKEAAAPGKAAQGGTLPQQVRGPAERALPDRAAPPRRRSSVVLEVRRHAERGDRSNEASELSEGGRAMAREVGARAGPFALVLASPALRARQTAQLIAGRLDAIEPGLLPDMSAVLPLEKFQALRSLADVGTALAREPELLAFAEAQLRAWSELARVGDEERVLAISHGGVLELVAACVAERLGTELDAPMFGYCEGIALTFRAGAPAALEVLRVTG